VRLTRGVRVRVPPAEAERVPRLVAVLLGDPVSVREAL